MNKASSNKKQNKYIYAYVYQNFSEYFGWEDIGMVSTLKAASEVVRYRNHDCGGGIHHQKNGKPVRKLWRYVARRLPNSEA